MLAFESAWRVLNAEHARIRELAQALQRDARGGRWRTDPTALADLQRRLQDLQALDNDRHRPKGVALVAALQGKSAEVDALLARLQASGCSFNRNGSWYPAAEARTHLLRKLEYLEDRDLVQTTEQFIARAGTGSSMSGKPYLVRCGNAAPQESRAWLTRELEVVRAAGRKPRVSP